jgi:ADP-heptose:LPS heptosyltransferase
VTSLLAVAPRHLGDGVMALPAMHALARVAPLRIDGPRWATDLYRDVPQDRSGPPPDAAVLFAPSLGAALRVRRLRRRIGTPTDLRGWLLTDPVAPGVHPRDTFAALASAAGARAEGPPAWRVRDSDPTVDVPDGHVGLVPLSASGAVRAWPGFRALADRVRGPVVWYAGPGEEAAIAAIAGRDPIRAGLSLPAFARALARCRALVSVDTGAAHFAAAAGARTVVVFGSTAPESSAPWGAEAVRGDPLPCAPCHRRRCALDRPRCFDGDHLLPALLERLS